MTPLSLGAAAGFAAMLLIGCGSSKPDAEERRPEPGHAAPVAETPPGENGEGNISFHYTNKSTDANLAIDLGTTDLYLEMTGRPNAPAAEAKPPQAESEEHHPAARKKEAAPTSDAGDEKEDAPQPEEQSRKAAPPRRQDARNAHAQPKPEPQLPEDDAGDYEDVTAKVLTGIRKAQELFYQKRYPEALQAVRSSLDARPTAEGHALAGSIQYMMGQGGMARREWLEALRLNPDLPAVVNMLEKTRTPGGRGSPNPRPIVYRPAPRAPVAPLPEADQAPYPEEYYGRVFDAPPAPPAPAAAGDAAPAAVPAQRANHLARPTQPRPSAPPAPEPVPPEADPQAEGDDAGEAAPAGGSAAPEPAPVTSKIPAVPAPAKAPPSAAPKDAKAAPSKAASQEKAK